ncbi:hypothetical protein NONI108955_21335 [Nocardia ninae]|uniref:hypothetical protein n=1 Tax=Nocardia ninae TaxID=356145 RepID=UPI001FEC74FF|nr:hypothetical protein [Nocardia ninae]
MSDSRTIVAAIDRVFTVATAEEAASLDGVVQAIARERGRPLTVSKDDSMPPGVFGQWTHFADRDEVSYAPWVYKVDRTVAHEMGHIVLGHRGRPVVDLAQSILPESMHGLAALMLRRECGSAGDADEETAAEQFAGMLLNRLQFGSRGAPRLRSRWGEAFS